MEHISELRESLNGYFGWNKARMTCFVKMLLALIVTRATNLNKLACAFASDAQQSSRYRRLQRFFSNFIIDYDMIAGFIFKIFFVANEKWYLAIDRTNWQWGKTDINILTLAIVFKGTAIPVYWELLDKKIPFYIRIRNNTVTTNSRDLTVDIDALFYALKPQEQRTIQGKRKVMGCKLYLAGLRLSDGDLLIVASSEEAADSIKIYGLRWEIETLFGCLKGRGFNFED